jgi:hypothetical protein
MENFFSNLDIFGRKINFLFKTQNSFKTCLGGIFTICSLLLIILFSFIIGGDFYYGTNPNINYETVVPRNYSLPLSLNTNNFLLAWRIEYYRKNFLDLNKNKILWPITRHFSYKRNSSDNLVLIKHEEIPTRKCNTQNAKIKDFTENYDIEEWYCLDWTTGNYTLGGFFDGDYVDAFQTQLYMCEGGAAYSKLNPNCTKIEEYEEFEKQNNKIQISIMYPHYFFVTEDLEDPLKLYYKNYYNYLSEKTFRIDRLFFQMVNLLDDQGIIFEHNYKDTEISFFDMQSDSNFNKIIEGGSSQIYEFNIYMEKSSLNIKRSFMKLHDLYAKLGGIIKIILVLFSALNGFFNFYAFQIEVLKEIFTLETEKEEFKNYNDLLERK